MSNFIFKLEVCFQKNLKNNKSKQYKEHTVNSAILITYPILTLFHIHFFHYMFYDLIQLNSIR